MLTGESINAAALCMADMPMAIMHRLEGIDGIINDLTRHIEYQDKAHRLVRRRDVKILRAGASCDINLNFSRASNKLNLFGCHR